MWWMYGGFVAAFYVALAAAATATRPGAGPRPEVAFVADSPEATLVFRMTGWPADGTTPPVRHPGEHRSPIHILRPDGRIDVRAFIADPHPAPATPATPATSATRDGDVPRESAPARPDLPDGWAWRMDVRDLAGEPKLPGTYRLYWESDGARSPEITFIVRPNHDWRGAAAAAASQPASPARRTPLTPNEVVREFYLALAGEEDADLRRVLTFPEAGLAPRTAKQWESHKSDPASEFAGQLVRRFIAARFVRHAVEDRWGPATAAAIRERLLPSGGDAVLAAMEADAADVTFSDYFLDAYVTTGQAPAAAAETSGRRVHLVRVDARWKVDAADLMDDRGLRRAVDATVDLKEVAGRVRNRQYKSFDELLADLNPR
jgi:hypothetical protein